MEECWLGLGGELGIAEAVLYLGSKIWDVNETCEGCKVLSKTPGLGKG